MNKWHRSVYHHHLPLTADGYVTMSREHVELSCRAAEEGMVLLKNNGALPLKKGTRVALLGKGTYDYVKGGGGSGEVHTGYVCNIADGVELLSPGCTYAPLNDFYRDYVKSQRAKGVEYGMMAEPELPAKLLDGAAKHADVAILSISRFSGEGWDRPCGFPCGEDDPWQQWTTEQRIDKGVFLEGDFTLTPAERTLTDQVFARFSTVIVLLNVGGVVDTAWLAEAHVDAALLSWQAGMEGGLAAAKILFGDVNPSGKLVDTFAAHISDYPSTAEYHQSRRYVHYYEDVYVGYRYFETIPGKQDRVAYPFGYGLSYTTFHAECETAERDGYALTFRVTVENTGSVPGKEVVQLYSSAPQGKLGKPARHLMAFRKTKLLLPGEKETFTLAVSLADAASYDDTGAVCKSAWVLEKGDYGFFLGTDVRNAAPVFTLTLEQDETVQQLTSHLAPKALPRRMKADGSFEELPVDPDYQIFPESSGDVPRPPFDPNAPAFQEEAVEGRILLREVAEGKANMEDFLAQLTDDELIHLCGGQPNLGVADTCGIGNLPQYGVPNIMTADGPAGVRINPPATVRTTAFPCGTLLACAWNPEIVEAVGAAGGAELKENDEVMWLTPAVNIHRNPLCGRNFEYYSEDPLVAGVTGAAMVRGIQSAGVSACVKHFACNDKEHFRTESDSRLSERALREIYLPAFQRIVKEAKPLCFMTSYNAVNGQRTAESRELITDILRGEWDYEGMVVTDWWGHSDHALEVLAGNDVKMPGGFPVRLREALDQGLITRDDLLKCVRRTMEFLCKIG